MPPLTSNRPLIQATVTNFFLFASLNAYVLLPLYIQELGGSEAEIGIIMGIYSAVGIVCQPLVGPWIDVLGRKPFMVFGAVVVGLSSVVAATATAIPALAAVRVLQGVGFSAFFVANFSYVMDLVPPERRGWALGIYGVSGLASTALAPLLGEWVIRRFGFRVLFALSVVFAIVAGALVARVRRDRRPDVPAVSGWGVASGAFGDVWERHMAVTLFLGLANGTIFVFLPTFAESLHVETLALFYTAYAVAAMGVRVVGGGLIDTRGRRAVIVPSMFVQVAAMLLFAALAFLVTRSSRMPIVPFLALVGFMSGGAHGLVYPALAALVADRTPGARRATAVGLFNATFLTGQAAGAFVFGYVTQAFGYGVMWTLLAALLMVGAIVSTGLDRGPSG